MRVLIVDDEPVARERLRRLLDRRPGVRAIHECGDGVEAVNAIREHEPDVVLLDIDMPGIDGFDVIRVIGVDAMPAVVFVTAFDAHAARAFDVEAIDYLVKPVEEQRLARALERAAHRHTGDPDDRQLARLSRALGRSYAPLRAMIVERNGRSTVVDTASIRRIEANDNYVRLFHAGGTDLLRAPLTALEARLDPGDFIRVHRSWIVRLADVVEVVRTRPLTLRMRDDSRIPVGATYRRRLFDRLDPR